MILRVSFAGQSISLDGVGEHHGGPCVVDRGERACQGIEIVASQIADGCVQLCVGDIGYRRSDSAGLWAGTGQPIP